MIALSMGLLEFLKSLVHKKGLLHGKTVYLIGAIDRAPDEGAGWRQILQKQLRKRYGCNVYNPLEKPIQTGIEDEKSRIQRRQWKESGEYDKLSAEVKIIRRVDLRMVDKADFMVCYIDLNVVFCGTMEEISLANRQKKPIIIFCKQGKKNIPDWLFGMLPHEMFFDNIDQVIEYLDGINNRKDTRDFGRWVFFDR